MKTNLTTQNINALAAKSVPYRVFDSAPGTVPGLHLQIAANTAIKTWVLAYSHGGVRRYRAIGRWPTINRDSARSKANELLRKLDSGESIARNPARAAIVNDLLDAYLADLGKRDTRASTVDAVKRGFKRNIRPHIGKMVVAEVKPVDVANALRKMMPHSAIQARQMRCYVHAAFAFGMKAEHALDRDGGTSFGINSNPVAAIPPPARSKPGEVFPSAAQLAATWKHAPSRGGASTIYALRMLVAMGGQRVEEVVNLRWEWLQEVDGIECICLPTTKTGRPHVVPLTEHAKQVLEDVRPYTGQCEVVFPVRHGTKTSIPYTTLATALRITRAKHPDMGVWSPRTVRRAGSTLLGEAGVSAEHRNLWLNHANGSAVATRHYDRSTRVREKLGVAVVWDRILSEAIDMTKDVIL